MSRLNPIQPELATGKAKELLDGVQARLKITPNMMRVMANSPAVLEGYLSFSGTLAGGALEAKLREQIALEVGEQNSCQYCVSAHTAIGKMTGLSDAEIEAARGASSTSPKNASALRFAHLLVDKHGRISDADLDAVRDLIAQVPPPHQLFVVPGSDHLGTRRLKELEEVASKAVGWLLSVDHEAA